MLLLYVLMGVPAGYSSSVLYKSFKGRQWQQCTLMTALLFPSMCFTVFLSLNLMSQRYHSTQVGGLTVTWKEARTVELPICACKRSKHVAWLR